MAISEEQLAAAIVKALENPAVRAGLLEAIIKPAVDAAVKDAVSASCEEMTRRLADQQRKIDGLETQVRQLTAVVTEQATALNDLDQYSRRGSIIVSGMPEQANESVEDKVIELSRCVGVDVAGHIDVAHRIGRLSAGHSEVQNLQRSAGAVRRPAQTANSGFRGRPTHHGGGGGEDLPVRQPHQDEPGDPVQGTPATQGRPSLGRLVRRWQTQGEGEQRR